MAAEAPHLLHVFATFAPGGPQVRTARLLAALGGEYRHTVVAMDGRTDARELLSPELAVELVPPPAAAGFPRVLLALRGLLRRLSPDLLLTYNWGAIETVLAARTLGLARRIHHEDGFRPDEAAGFKRRRVLFRRLALAGGDALIVPSRTLADLATGLWKQPPRRVHYIPNGIEVDRFPPRGSDAAGRRARRAELGVPVDAPVVGAVGHLRAEKNYPRLVRAFARLGSSPPPHLLILGDGEERAELERLAAEPALRGRVHLPGHREELAPWYGLMDAFAISSDTEQMPVALLEAMSAELPVVSTDVGDVRRMLPDGQGDLVVPLEGERTEELLAQALARLLADPEARARLGAENRRRVLERFTFEVMLDAYRERYRAALGRPRGGALA